MIVKLHDNTVFTW